MSRLEATVPEVRMQQVNHLESELGLNKSQIVDEALSLFFKTVMEVKRGCLIAFLDPQSDRIREFTSPALTQVEWATQRERLLLKDEDFERVQKMVEHPPEPTAALKEAVSRERRRRKTEE